jgi:hypothetical protein
MRARRLRLVEPRDDGAESLDVTLLPRRCDVRELHAADHAIEAHTGFYVG